MRYPTGFSSRLYMFLILKDPIQEIGKEELANFSGLLLMLYLLIERPAIFFLKQYGKPYWTGCSRFNFTMACFSHSGHRPCVNVTLE